MYYAIYTIVVVLEVLLSALDFLLLVRAVCSWVPDFRNSVVYNISFRITEPVLKPVRNMMWKMGWARRLPIDVSFLAVCIITLMLQKLVPYLFYLVI